MDPSRPGRSPPTAWQPFTFAGVAAFAQPSAAWLWAVLLAAGLLLGWAAASYLSSAWHPAVDQAIQRLPAAGEIRSGALVWPTHSVVELANNGWLSLVVNPSVGPVPGRAADVSIEFTTRTLTAQSLFGYWALPYPPHLHVPLNRPALEPWWAAWQPHLRVGVPVAFALSVILAWMLIGLVLAPLIRLLAFWMRREINLGGCWRLVVASLVPAGCGTAVGLLLYASHGFRLLDCLAASLLAHAYSLVLLAGAPFCLPAKAAASPFVLEEAAPDAEPQPVEIPSTLTDEPRATNPGFERSPFGETDVRPIVRNPFAASNADSGATESEGIRASLPTQPPRVMPDHPSDVSGKVPPAEHMPTLGRSRAAERPLVTDAELEDPLNPS